MTGRIESRKSESAASTLPEIGKIKIGEKAMSQGGKEYPKSLDYFKPTGNFANEFTMKYGDKPTKLSVCFVSDDLGEVCNERFESWVKGKRWGYGDGKTFTVWDSSAAEGKGAYIANLSSSDQRVKALKWDVMLTLRFVLLELKGIMGYWRFETKAKATTIPSVIKSFDFVRERAGTIIGFPFNLIIERKTGYNPGEAKSYPVVTLVPNFSQDAIEMVSNYLEAGGNVHKLTTAMIEQKKILTEGGDKKLLAETTQGGAQ
jgi:hypothetical protein